MLDKVKTALRIKSNNESINLEIQLLIDSCKIDLSIGGVSNLDENNPIIQMAIILYCKSRFGNSNTDSEKYWNSYESLKTNLKLTTEFGFGGGTNVVQ